MDVPITAVHTFYVLLLLLGRTAGVLIAAPIPGNRPLPPLATLGFSLCLSLALLSQIAPRVGPIPPSLVLLAYFVAQNLVFGIMLGYIARFLFTAMEIAGSLSDSQMGLGFINLIDPFSELQSSLLSAFYNQLSLVLYLLLNGHLLLIAALATSFRLLPPDAPLLHSALGLAILPAIKTVFLIGLRLALPVIGVLFLADAALGFMARMAPQVNVFFVGLPAKLLIGIMTVAIILPALAFGTGQLMLGIDRSLNLLLTKAH
ncbi:flagellar biosynthetic protein FliR [Chthonomonas calidirosea]|uniref:flagellar biosynthetic protein FliR n=1 Tax=Chthonomonas calidirosea TaxID=454171 RepID=UPI0006EC4BD9|nr:flagellar biosynthetic protein FliR [Chthonomonas calidirosea]CEK15334.1 flagellar biosynthesis pathway, component FliR [Chthonomonas calidirosea]